ncbi:MAG: hypothetical protein RM049_15945 [Nostoc sp. DedQUE04]|uniref:hypothetical protein n=1 Tax=Nostoc sp. DedQUE04 TaxID=3075390 RepID=UPI002AD2273F|nr:hypothetical protein [Nostoc sp. DedQUE04]MDZ8136778.1 hypothetical protein [Nostoc sp. DedQUE04]
MTLIKENFKRIWDCLVKKAPEIIPLFQPGLKPEEIDDIIKDLPGKLPEEIYEIYQWRNGLLKEVGLSGWPINESSIVFHSLQAAIQNIQKVIIAGQPTYFLTIFSLLHENGGDYFTVPIGQDICSVIVFYDDDHFIEFVDYQKEFVPKLNSTLIENVNSSANFSSEVEENIINLEFSEKYLEEYEESADDFLDDIGNLFQIRKAYNSLKNLLREIADCCEQGFNRLEVNEYNFINVYLDKEKCNFIHYRHRAAKKYIYCLTLEQEAQLYEIKQSWLDVINASLNHQSATKVIRDLYAYAGEDIPDIIFVPSFYTAHLGILKESSFLEQIQNNYLAQKLKSLYWNLLLTPFDYVLAQPVIPSILNCLESELSEFLSSFIEDDLKFYLREFFSDKISPFFQQIIKILYSGLKYDLKNILGNNFIQSHLSYKYIVSNEDFISSAALFEFAKILGVKFDEQKLNLFISYCREIWCIIPFDQAIIVSEKPQITWQNDCSTKFIQQPSLTFPDGYSI